MGFDLEKFCWCRPSVEEGEDCSEDRAMLVSDGVVFPFCVHQVLEVLHEAEGVQKDGERGVDGGGGEEVVESSCFCWEG